LPISSSLPFWKREHKEIVGSCNGKCCTGTDLVYDCLLAHTLTPGKREDAEPGGLRLPTPEERQGMDVAL
jgi:hypothetical protein